MLLPFTLMRLRTPELQCWRPGPGPWISSAREHLEEATGRSTDPSSRGHRLSSCGATLLQVSTNTVHQHLENLPLTAVELEVVAVQPGQQVRGQAGDPWMGWRQGLARGGSLHREQA